jgi:tetratricopeptide (TPR) repeat protein
LVHRKIAAELDPVSPYAVQAAAGYLSVVGRYDEGIQQFLSALSLDPNFWLAHQGLGVAYLLKGMPAEAIDELKKADQLMTGPRRRALLGYAYAVLGKTSEARRILNEFLKQASDKDFPALAVAQVYIGLGERDRAFEWLDKAIDQRDLDLTLQWDSPYESLRSDPRFTALLRRMKLACPYPNGMVAGNQLKSTVFSQSVNRIVRVNFLGSEVHLINTQNEQLGQAALHPTTPTPIGVSSA